MINPYFCYAASFSIALSMYLLGWSDLYPSLSLAVIFFILVTIVTHVLAGIKLAAQQPVTFRKLRTTNELSPLWITVFLYALWCTEFMYEGGIPFFNILLQKPFDYRLFGIPTVHVLIVTFSSFYTLYLFHLFLSGRSFRILVLYVINMLSAILIYNRGMLLFNVSASALLLLIYMQRVSIKQLAFGVTGAVLVLFLFGVLGSLRVSHESRVPYSNELFLKTGHASREFRDSGVPPEFFWTYVYVTSPLANLENNVRVADPREITWSTFLQWVNNEVLFDFISKRINRLTDIPKVKENNIPGPFNATTVFSGSFSYLGWWGLVLMAIVILLIPILYMRIVSTESPFFLTGLVILNTLFLFMIFDNTIRFTGFSFQIVYPVLLSIFSEKAQWLKKIFLSV